MSVNRHNTLTNELIISERRRRESQRLSGVGFWELDHVTNVLYWSEEIFSIYEINQQDNPPNYQLFLSLIYEEDKELVDNSYQSSVESGDDYNIRYRIKAGGSVKWLEARGVTYYDENGHPERTIGTAEDISEIITAHQKIEHMAYHDVLTGLANRTLFADKLNEALLLASQQQTNLAVLFIDLDNFKLVNDQCGHDIGDEVLVSVGNKLRARASNSDLFARLGGDEFAGFLFGIDDSEIDVAVKSVKQSIEGTYKTGMHTFNISASIGVTIYPRDDEDTDILLRHADQAMYEAKEQGKSRIRYFDTERFQSNWSRRHFLKDIETALNHAQFELYYQPRIRLSDGQMFGAEARLRWFRPEGAVSPIEIVTAIKNTFLEWELDKWVIETVLTHSKIFKAKGLQGPFSLNVNSSSLENPEFPTLLHSLLAKLDVRGEDIEIEILEMESINSFDDTRKILLECEALGVRFSLDDFGTGYSSLTYFHALPISKLKIDQRFVKSIHSDPDSLLLVKSILAIANANNKPVVAEGVETDEIADTLAQLDCEFGQGYGIARPMPISDYINWTQNNRKLLDNG
jgi:diguanylate cyclase (GGDEF)-like protein/PAS domain S-box-containing protein